MDEGENKDSLTEQTTRPPTQSFGERSYYGLGLQGAELGRAVKVAYGVIDSAWKDERVELARSVPYSTIEGYRRVYKKVQTDLGKPRISKSVFDEALRMYREGSEEERKIGITVIETASMSTIFSAIRMERRLVEALADGNSSALRNVLGVSINKDEFEENLLLRGLEIVREQIDSEFFENMSKFKQAIHHEMQKYARIVAAGRIGIPQTWVKDGIVDWIENYVDTHGRLPSEDEVAKRLHVNVSGPMRGKIQVLLGYAEVEMGGLSPDKTGDGIYGTESEALLEFMGDDLDYVLQELEPREAEVIRDLFGLTTGRSLTLAETATKYRLTSDRIRQIEDKAIRRMRHRGRIIRDWLN